MTNSDDCVCVAPIARDSGERLTCARCNGPMLGPGESAAVKAAAAAVASAHGWGVAGTLRAVEARCDLLSIENGRLRAANSLLARELTEWRAIASQHVERSAELLRAVEHAEDVARAALAAITGEGK